MAGKLSKQELKEPDKFQVMLSRGMVYLTEHRKNLYVAGGVLTAILILSGAWYLYDRNMEQSAQQLYAKTYLSAPGDNVGVVTLYKDVTEKYPGSRAAALSRYRLANLYLHQNNFDEAIKAYQAYLKQSSDQNDLTTLTWMGLGYAYEAKKDFKNALSAFEKAGATKTGNVFEGMNDQNMARIYEALNDRSKALSFYQKALTKNTDPASELLIKRKIASLS